MSDLPFKIVEKLFLELKYMGFETLHVYFISVAIYQRKSDVSLTRIVAQKLLFFVSLDLFFERRHIDPWKSTAYIDKIVKYFDIVVFVEGLTEFFQEKICTYKHGVKGLE